MWFFKFSAVEARVLIWQSLSLKHKTAPKNAWEEAASNQFSSCWYLEPKPGNCEVEKHERSCKKEPAGKGDWLAGELLDELVHHLQTKRNSPHKGMTNMCQKSPCTVVHHLVPSPIDHLVNPIRTGFFWYLKDSGREGGQICPHPLTIGGNGWEVPKLSWNLISYRDWCQTKGFMTFRYQKPPKLMP